MWDIIHDIRLQATENVKKALHKFYNAHMPAVQTDTDLFKEHFRICENYGRSQRVTELLASVRAGSEAIKRSYEINSTSSLRSEYDFDVSVGFRQYNGRIYLIPYCDLTMNGVLDFLKKDSRLTDFHYQNSTDKPKSISEKAWDKRRDVWYGMSKEGRFKDVLLLYICRFDMYWDLEPSHELIKEILEREPAKGVDTEPTGSEK
jgi:hypothetical protein